MYSVNVLRYPLLSIATLISVAEFCVAQDSRIFGDFVQAGSVSLDPQGDVYITDTGANKIQKFSPEGKLITEIGGYGWGQLEFDQPYEVCATNGLDVFVADYGNHRIQRFNRKLEYIATLYKRDHSDEIQRFGYPTGVTVNRFGDLFLSDGENQRLLRVSGFERVVRSVGGVDAGKGRLREPKQVEVDAKDNVYVLEHNRIVVFDNFGNYLQIIGQDTLRTASGFTIHGSSIFVIDRGLLLEFTLEGKLGDATPCSSIASESRDQECVDIAADDSRRIVLFHRFAVIVQR